MITIPVGFNRSNPLVTSGLILGIEPGKRRSGVVYYDGSSAQNNLSIGGGYSHSTLNGGCIQGNRNTAGWSSQVNPQLINSLTELTIMLTIKCSETMGESGSYSQSTFLSYDDSTAGNRKMDFAITSSDTKTSYYARFILFDNLNNNKQPTCGLYTLGSIVTCGVTISGKNLKTYNNGNLYSSSSFVGDTIKTAINSSVPFSIGGAHQSYSTWMCGNLYNLFVYNRALTDEEMLKNYNYSKSVVGF